MKQVAAALLLLLITFLMPIFLISEDAVLSLPEGSLPTATLPTDRPSPTAGGEGTPQKTWVDEAISVTVQDGDQVLSLSMEEYLWHVVAAEMPAAFELEALKAQAAAARTYTLYKMTRTTARHPDAAVCTDSNCCSAYITQEDANVKWGTDAQVYSTKIRTAVAQTDGMVIWYQDTPIQAVFHSSSGHYTEDAYAVWGRTVPYLQSVSTPEEEGTVPNYTYITEIPAADFKTLFLKQWPDADLSGSPGTWVRDIVYSDTGSVTTASVGGITVKGTTLRTILGLRSAAFQVTNRAESLVFTTIGYGHGVGMSQYGANALAKEGKGYQDILRWYYLGVTLAPYEPAETQ